MHIPILTTVQRDALTPTAGMLVYNSTTTQFNKYENGAWRADLGFNSDHGGLSGLADDDHTIYQKEDLLTTQGDLPYATAASTWARLPKGTGLQLLRMNAGATAPEWATAGLLLSKLKSETRALDAASGAVSYTGYGFQPKALIIFASAAQSVGGVSWGFGDLNLAEMCFYATDTAGNFLANTTIIVYAHEISGKTQTAVLTTLDADGFTLTWTRTGVTSAGTITLLVLALQ